METAAVKLENISKAYKLYGSHQDRLKEALHPFRKQYHRIFYALKDIDLEASRGEIIGIVGRNGSGKSTMLKIISGILKPTEGNVYTRGRISAILELSSGFNQEYTGIENIYQNLSLSGFTKEEIDEKLEEIIKFSELDKFIYQPIKTYSSGMKARLGFSVSTIVDPDILILDEVLSVGDALFQRKCFARMEEIFEKGNLIFYVSHSEKSVVEMCTRAILLDEGRVIAEDKPGEIIKYYHNLLYGGGKALKTTMSAKSAANNHDKDNSDPVSYFIENFKPKSTKIIKNADIEIKNIRIETLSGRKVNVLQSGNKYKIKYRVIFHKAYKKVAFPVEIKMHTGVVLGGMRYPDIGKEFDVPADNTAYDLEIDFHCNLLRGNFLLNIGVPSFESGQKEVLLNIFDAYIFKVNSKARNKWSTIDFGEISLKEKIPENAK